MDLASGIITADLSPSIRPQDDLFRHVNGAWLDRTTIPADKARFGAFYKLAEEAEKAVQHIILEAAKADEGTVERKLGDLYTAFLAVERIDELGIEPIRADLEAALSVSTIEEFLTVLGGLEAGGTGGFFRLFVDNDPGDPERYLVFVEQGGLGLPNESYYHDPKFVEVRAQYERHVRTMFELAELPDAQTRAERIVALEHLIAATHWDNVRTRDSHATYNLTRWQDVAAEAKQTSGIDLSLWLDAVGIPAEKVEELVIREPDFVTSVTALLTKEHLIGWRDWLVWQVLRGSASLLPAKFSEEQFEFYGKALTGTPKQRDRWKRAVSLVEGSMGEAIGQIYVREHFPPVAKERMDVLVANLIEAYRQSITNLDWMTQETRVRALEKLDKFTPKIGYPVKWRDYSELQLTPGDLVASVKAVHEFEFARELGKLGAPIDRDEWFMTPQTINAYYNPGFNEIVFPAAILQPPFFSPDWDDAANYGAIGAVIGHEIGHGFDDQGSRFDGDGKLTDWWTEADRTAFEQRTSALIAQYDALAPQQVPDHHVNGALTIGENIGDLGGLSIAWKAYLLSLGDQEPPVLDGLTAAERFFFAWAGAWQQKSRDEEVIRLLTIDPHSPNEFRCNQIVRNIDEFHDTFGVSETDALWLPPEQRVRIW